MYSPAVFKVEDRETLIAFMRHHSFATIITHDAGIPHATQMPVLFREVGDGPGTLVSHLARANPQWRHFETGGEVLVLFTGPHAYVSPAWYTTIPAVPTWNYTAVHVYGKARLITDHDAFAAMLHELIEFHEADSPKRWDGEMPDEFRDGLMKAIVGFEIEITRIEGKFKLSQNRPDDAPGIIAALTESRDQTDREVAAMMEGLMP
jgi:transcriptional regulator